MNFLSLILMAPQGGQQGGSPLGSLIPLLLVIVIFYFFMIRPQMKKQKEVKQFRESIKAGDKVLTVGGIYGRVSEVKDQTVLLEIADGVRIKVDKAGLVKDTTDVAAAQK
jgi:preprotein translocase subunit YajC